MRFSICRVKIVGPARIGGGAWELRGGAWEVRGGIARPAVLEPDGGPWEVRGGIARPATLEARGGPWEVRIKKGGKRPPLLLIFRRG